MFNSLADDPSCSFQPFKVYVWVIVVDSILNSETLPMLGLNAMADDSETFTLDDAGLSLE